MPLQEVPAALQSHFQGVPSTQPAPLATEGCTDAAPGASVTPATHQLAADQDPHPAPLPPTSTLLCSSPSPPIFHCSSCSLLLFPPPPAFSSPSITHPTPHLLSPVHISSSHNTFPQDASSTFNLYFPSTTLPVSFSQVWTSLPHQTSSLHAQTLRIETLIPKNSRQPDTSSPQPQGSSLLLKHKHPHVKQPLTSSPLLMYLRFGGG